MRWKSLNWEIFNMSGSTETFVVRHEWECSLCHAHISDQLVCFGKGTYDRIEQVKNEMEKAHILEHKKARALDDLVESLREAIDFAGYKEGFVWK